MLKIFHLQFVFFPINFNLPENSRAKFLSDISKKYEGSQIILPIPSDILGDIPFMLLQRQGEYEISFSRNRIEIKVDIVEDNQIDKADNITIDILKHLEENNIGIKDIGFIIRSKDEEKPNERFNSFINNNVFFDYSKESENYARSLKRIIAEIDGINITINESKALNTGAKDTATNKDLLILEFDRNTFPKKESVSFNQNFVKDFIDKAKKANQDFTKNS